MEASVSSPAINFGATEDYLVLTGLYLKTMITFRTTKSSTETSKYQKQFSFRTSLIDYESYFDFELSTKDALIEDRQRAKNLVALHFENNIPEDAYNE